MITFDQLIALYRNTEFSKDGSAGKLTVRDYSIVETLKQIESDEKAFDDAAFTVDSASAVVIGATVSVEIGAPRTGLGFLALTLDRLLENRRNRIAEPERYYLIEERFAYNDTVVPDAVARYRNALRLVRTLKEAAAFLDPYQAEMLFLGSIRLMVRVDFRSSDLVSVNSILVDEFENFVMQKVHKDQKAAIVATTLIETCRTHPEGERFRYLLRHFRDFVTKCEDSYRLFASEFSYDKIRGKAEEAIADYTGKIHKTFHDIQNQIMGIPVASVIIATQLKPATQCDVNFWANLAISLGAPLFVALLAFAIVNQLLTLSTIDDDLTRQKTKLKGDYSVVAAEFLPLYRKLENRITLHRFVLGIILVVCGLGALLTWRIYFQLTTLMPWAC
ncbi:hypothetical protein EN742_06080 [Mesorhizobium sp. M4A.F.Ca.ET.020.02.1.1]|uniref:hypothetical protein n=1 Tax=Mesorhizobium sp. M4A.F.Ca.ET.020.02.1.1 TaxID=2496652 RepID=UPI000FD50C78|nr:hypothetical protein [Mesorhizobium sp. M4A.F.Ca.ET.020.02.1.1]RVD43036.1 hypothetical protein EN742_06080 [Mesorhizobium sp. M4A.F.Ca.ET.020.02.1.1]